MKAPELPHNEIERLNALRGYEILDSLDEQEYDDITTIASEICQTPICVISLIDENRQWFKSKVGLSVSETSREVSFCGHAILQPNDVLIVPDARKDERFHDNPLVTGNPDIVFYAGVPLIDEKGFALGTICAIDTKPRELSQQQVNALKILSKKVIALLSIKKKNIELEQSRQFLIDCINFSSPYFLLLNDKNEILELGVNFLIANSAIKKGALFSNFFFWNSRFDSKKLIDGSDLHQRMLFFSSVDEKQKFKCSVKKNDEKSYFLFATPVINTQFPINNYNVNITNFAKQDYIAEYLFLQQAANKGLEDSKKLNELLQQKNKQLEISKDALVNVNAVLEERVSKRTKLIKHLALFPEQNPNPLLEVNYESKEISYINPAAKLKIEEKFTCCYNELTKWFKLDQETIAKKDTTKIEIELNDKIYERNVFFLDDNKTFRLYLHDITDIRLKEKAEKEKNKSFLIQQNALLEIRSINHDLNLNDKLKIIYKKTAEVLNCDRCSVWFYDENKTRISAETIYLKLNDTYVDGTSIYAEHVPSYFKALDGKIVIAATDAETHHATFEFKETYLQPLNIKSMLDVPLLQAEDSIGVIRNEYLGKQKTFTDEEISFSRSVADKIVLAYETEQLKVSQEELKNKNVALKEALDQLVNMQSEIVHQEKMATLGMLIAGIAHEINTPLGAIKASSENLHQGILFSLIEKIKTTPKEVISEGINLFNLSSKTDIKITTREERQLIKKIEEQLTLHLPLVENKNLLARKLTAIGFTQIDEKLYPYLTHENQYEIFAFATDLNTIMKSIDTIDIAVNKASKVVKALNTFSHGNIENEISTFNLHDNIDSVVTLLWNKIKHGSTVINSIDKQINITANPEELSQVWSNIINNALQASNNKCTVWIDYREEENKHVISIVNNGPAIPEYAITKIFDAFYSTKKRGEGTGLGLNIVKKIVEKHNGEITCTSNEEKTTFIISLSK